MTGCRGATGGYGLIWFDKRTISTVNSFVVLHALPVVLCWCCFIVSSELFGSTAFQACLRHCPFF